MKNWHGIIWLWGVSAFTLPCPALQRPHSQLKTVLFAMKTSCRSSIDDGRRLTVTLADHRLFVSSPGQFPWASGGGGCCAGASPASGSSARQWAWLQRGYCKHRLEYPWNNLSKDPIFFLLVKGEFGKRKRQMNAYVINYIGQFLPTPSILVCIFKLSFNKISVRTPGLAALFS